MRLALLALVACGSQSPPPPLAPVAATADANSVDAIGLDPDMIDPNIRPVVATAPPPPTGALAPATIRKAIKQHITQLASCYEKVTEPNLSNGIMATFTIGTDGKVIASTATGGDRVVADCVAGVIKGIAFPAPTGGVVNVSYPFNFGTAGT